MSNENVTNIEIDFGNDGIKVMAKMYKDGDQWCVMIGENIQEGIAGFGHQTWQAIGDFKSNFRNS
jgi:hypothetical protein